MLSEIIQIGSVYSTPQRMHMISCPQHSVSGLVQKRESEE